MAAARDRGAAGGYPRGWIPARFFLFCMKHPTTALVDASRDFHLDELFFSATDARGVIVAGNAVFTRVSGFAAEDLLGQPHNIIRHPDMPRAIFRLFWERLKAGQPVAAYVKNRARDGRYYWVLALATPVAGGYLSIRFKPSGPLHPPLAELYREMCELERTAAARGASGPAAMQAATERLLAALRERGFESYEDFMRLALLREELDSRDRLLTQQALFPPLPPAAAGEGAWHAGLRAAYAAGRRAGADLTGLYGQLGEFARLNDELRERTRRVLHLTTDFGLVAFNVSLKAGRLGHLGGGIDVIARNMEESAARIGGIVRELGGRVAGISAALGDVIFGLAWARLQFEMTIFYYRESLTSEGATPEAILHSLRCLQQAFRTTGEQVLAALGVLARELSGLDERSTELGRLITTLQVSQVAGLVEVSRLPQDEAFAGVFAEVRAHIEQAHRSLAQIGDVAARLGELAAQAPATARTIAAASAQLAGDSQRLEAARPRDEVEIAPERALAERSRGAVLV